MKQISLLLLAFSLAPAALGCTICVGKPLKLAFQDSTYFFVGEAVDVQLEKATFLVVEQLKGDSVSEVTLATSSSCSLSGFRLGETYLTEATPTSEGALHADLCSHTHALDAEDRRLDRVRKRAPWWNSGLSRVLSWYRFRLAVVRMLGG